MIWFFLKLCGAYSFSLLDIKDIEFVNCVDFPTDTLIYADTLGTTTTIESCVSTCVNRPWCVAALYNRQHRLCFTMLSEEQLFENTPLFDNDSRCLILKKSNFINELKQVNIFHCI